MFDQRWRTGAALALLALAFGLAAVKVQRHPPPASFQVSAPAQPTGAESLPQALPAVPALSQAPPLEFSVHHQFKMQAQFVSSTPGKAVHAASLVALRDGRLRAVWFAGSREGAGDVAIKTAVMDPTHLRWGAERTLIDRTQLQQGLWRYVKKLGNPVIARAADGSLHLWMVNVSLGGWAGSSISWSRSTDEGETWSPARRLVTSPFLNVSTLVKGAPLLRTNGEVVLPVYHEFIAKFAEVVRLNEQGRVLDKTRIPASQTSLQPVLIAETALRAHIYMRSGTATALMQSSTEDAGNTWTPTRVTTWPNPDSALAGVHTLAGDQWLALNPSARNREMLTLLKMKAGEPVDRAQSWLVESSVDPSKRVDVPGYEALLHQELMARGATPGDADLYVASARRQLCGAQTCAQEFSYPYLLQTPDGYLHLIYTWHRARIKYVRLDPMQTLMPDTAGAPDDVALH